MACRAAQQQQREHVSVLIFVFTLRACERLLFHSRIAYTDSTATVSTDFVNKLQENRIRLRARCFFLVFFFFARPMLLSLAFVWRRVGVWVTSGINVSEDIENIRVGD